MAVQTIMPTKHQPMTSFHNSTFFEIESICARNKVISMVVIRLSNELEVNFYKDFSFISYKTRNAKSRTGLR